MDNLSQTTTVQSAAMAALHAVEAREAEKQARKEAGIADAINGETGQNVVSRTTSSQSKKSSTGSRTTPAPESESDDYDLGDSDYDSSDSFCLVPSKSSSGDQPTTSKKVLADARWQDPAAWLRSAVLNTAHMGWFSSDRTITEYAEEIWRVPVRR